MNRRQRKQRARRRSRQYAAEKILAVLSGKRYYGILRHGKSWTFHETYKSRQANGKE